MKEKIKEIIQDKLSVQEWPNCGQPYTCIDGWDEAATALHRLFIEKQVGRLEELKVNIRKQDGIYLIDTLIANLKKELEK